MGKTNRGVKRRCKGKGPGRPAADPANPRNVRIQTVISAADLRRLDRRRGKVSRSEWIYRAILRSLQAKGG